MSTETMRQQSPLDQFFARIGNSHNSSDAAVVMQERAFLTHINLARRCFQQSLCERHFVGTGL